MKSQPVRVLVVISNLGFGGAERQVVELVNHLDPARFEAYVCTLSEHVPLASRLANPDRLFTLHKRAKYDFSVVFSLCRLIRKLNIDVVHGFLFDAEIASRLAARLAGVQVVLGSERNSHYDMGRVHRLAYRLTGPLVDFCIANTRAGADFNRQLFGYPESFYRVVYNGVDSRRFQPDGDDGGLRAELGLSAEHFVVGMFASFKKQKNHPSLLRAAAKVLETHPHIKFLLVGEKIVAGKESRGSYKEEIQQLVQALKLEKACIFLGARADVERVYNACSVTALPSFHEGTPNVALESMACGVPVIASDVADNSRVIPHGKAGYIFALNDDLALANHIRELHDQPQTRRQLALGARSWVEEKFSLQAMANNMADVYLEALALPKEAG